MTRLLIIALMACRAHSAEWFASPVANAGDGSFGNPWNFQVAATNGLIQNGDTLYLRGTNIGNFTGNYLSRLRCTVRSYPGEWAKFDNSAVGNLDLAANAGDTLLRISGGGYWQPAQVIIVDGENIQLSSLANGTNWTVNRGWNGTTAAAHSANARAIVKAPIINHVGTNATFMGFEMTSVMSTNRYVAPGGTNNHYISPAINCDEGTGNKFINLVIHNVGHPAIGFWDQGTGGEINGCVMWGNGIYDWNGANWIRGTAAYMQNKSGEVFIKNNISFRNFTEGLQAYGTTGITRGFRLLHNICMMSPNGYGLSVWNEQTPMPDNSIWTNYLGINGLAAGYTSPSNTDLTIVGNWLVVPNTLFIKNTLTGYMTNNTVLLDSTYAGNNGLVIYQYPTTNRSAITFNVNRNTYYRTNGDDFQFNFETSDVESEPSGGPGKVKFSGDGTNTWPSWTGWDTASTYQAGWPTNIQKVEARKTDYDALRSHAVVINTDTNTTNAVLQLGTLGFHEGDVYVLRDAQNYFTPITTSTFSGTPINLPLNRTNVSEILGTLTHYTNVHTNVRYPGLFNAFVIDRVPKVNRTKMKGIRLRR